MSLLRDIYTQVILDHYRKPRNKGELDDATHMSRCDNPLCGDKVFLWLKVEDEKIVDVKFAGNGCAISQASASIMTQMIKGKTCQEALKLKDSFREMLLEKDYQPDIKVLGELIALEGVKKLHARVKCAVCAWHALDSALKGEAEVSTEKKDMLSAPIEAEGEVELAEWEKEI